MKETLLPYLVCVNCGGEFSTFVAKVEDAEIMEGALKCLGCGERVPILRGIPYFSRVYRTRAVTRTVERFGYQWNAFYNISDYYEKQFLDWIHPLTPDDFRGKVVLDAGCGKGRHAFFSASFGAREVIAFDLSPSVEAAFRNTRHLPNVHIVRADIHRLPLKPVFDLAYCIGVLHHLPDPAKGFHTLRMYIRPGGCFAAWVYGRENNGWIVWLFDPVRKAVTSRLPYPILKVMAWTATLFLYPVLRYVYRPVNRRMKPISRLLFYNDYFAYISQFPFREIYGTVVFDHMTAPIAHYLPKAEVERWIAHEDLEEVRLSPWNRNSWRALVRRRNPGSA
ncbi:MAG TPA: methyltransferase domain-containing protein [Candidatus Polarisedimenticolia bacterium]|jgi:SAM-dependent methyltransferase/uncharacterized protein YbaR (Trm112 family)|nr:methyltransferase domain-containing protein [Candidatus Polarisedimenticolia bacterium]